MGKFWTADKKAALGEIYVLPGFSFVDIATAINKRFGSDYTRNAIAGQAKRMNLNGKYSPPVKRTPSPKNQVVEVTPRHLSLYDLEANDCRFPYGDKSITFCGHPKADGSSYCAYHQALCWRVK